MALRDSDPAEVGGYRIEDRLGSGGMGVVYLARSASGRPLAIKVVHGQYADDDEFRARFRREVAAARQVSGAFTAPVVDADADAPRPWMATLYIPGADLGTHVREHGPLPLPRLRELAAGLAEALRDMHRAGVVHRDLKPANVMLADDGPRVIDFGISRAAEFAASDVLTQTGRVMGTPPFMSPEQFASPQDVGPAADIFSLGSVLTHAATRRGPFDSPSPYETALRVVEGEPELSGVPDELLPVIRRCLEKHHKSRPTADQLLTLLRDGSAPAAHLLPTTGSSQARPTEPAGTVWPDAAPAEQDEEQPHRGDEGQQPHRSGRARTERHERPRDTAGTPTPTPTPDGAAPRQSPQTPPAAALGRPDRRTRRGRHHNRRPRARRRPRALGHREARRPPRRLEALDSAGRDPVVGRARPGPRLLLPALHLRGPVPGVRRCPDHGDPLRPRRGPQHLVPVRRPHGAGRLLLRRGRDHRHGPRPRLRLRGGRAADGGRRRPAVHLHRRRPGRRHRQGALAHPDGPRPDGERSRR
ncbi:serine/threonine-protein kinase [Streptomyces afghaniensis]|uniref:serine/threonine-protein kinase n=1 Tax=Streptomyces afghaniensis TaxID=66865 RepID=UPI00041EDB50|nr:serine/threonine-protein kinase [Streptomyces afghaniensis]